MVTVSAHAAALPSESTAAVAATAKFRIVFSLLLLRGSESQSVGGDHAVGKNGPRQ
jgi:hypothetical protein